MTLNSLLVIHFCVLIFLAWFSYFWGWVPHSCLNLHLEGQWYVRQDRGEAAVWQQRQFGRPFWDTSLFYLALAFAMMAASVLTFGRSGLFAAFFTLFLMGVPTLLVRIRDRKR
jgi:Flp pilus assembly protein TadB